MSDDGWEEARALREELTKANEKIAKLQSSFAWLRPVCAESLRMLSKILGDLAERDMADEKTLASLAKLHHMLTAHAPPDDLTEPERKANNG